MLATTRVLVDPVGGVDDGDTSTAFLTLAAGQDAARKLVAGSSFGGSGVEIALEAGRHQLSSPLLLEADLDSGIYYRAADGGTDQPVVSGGVVISGWSADNCPTAGSGLLVCASVADLGELASSRHLFVNGRRAGRGVVPQDIVDAFASPVAVDDDHYTVSDAAAAELALWPSPATVEFVYTGQGSPWTESRCTALNVSGVDVFLKQPCFATLQHKPCGQSTSIPVTIENAGPQ